MSRRENHLGRRMELAHYRFQMGLYMTAQERRDESLLVRSPTIEAPEWNHAALVDMSGPDREAALRDVENFFHHHKRRPTVALSPMSRPSGYGDHLVDNGYARSFKQAWLYHRGSPPDSDGSGPTIRRMSGEDDQLLFLDCFHRGHDEPETAGYGPALEASFRYQGDFESLHFLAELDGEAVGVATLIHDGWIAGLYNLAVVPEARRRGVGRALTNHRLAMAHASGCDLAFLQTEEKPVEHWQRKHGFELAFTLEGWTLG